MLIQHLMVYMLDLTLYVVNNAGRGEQSKISAYDAALRRVTVQTPFTITPNTSSGYTISPTLLLAVMVLMQKQEA